MREEDITAADDRDTDPDLFKSQDRTARRCQACGAEIPTVTDAEYARIYRAGADRVVQAMRELGAPEATLEAVVRQSGVDVI